jgi:uncharacterized protein (TIGR03435 family)
MNGTMDDLAFVLATGLESPVVNETGIEGTFDARFKIEGREIDNISATLENTLGLELVQGNQEMPITVFEVSERPERAPDPATKTEPQKP